MTAVRSVIGDVTGSNRSAPPVALEVAVQRSRRAPAGEVQLAATVVVAVERGDAAADEVLEVTLVAVVDAAGFGDEDGARRQPRAPSSARRGRQHQQGPEQDRVPPRA